MLRIHTSGRRLLILMFCFLLIGCMRKVHDRSKDTSSLRQQDSAPKYGYVGMNNDDTVPLCVAVLTGYPDVARKEYIDRILNNILNITAGIDIKLHVFCQGNCKKTLQKTCDKIGNYVFHETNETVHMKKDKSFQKQGDIFHDKRWYYLSTNYYAMLKQLFDVYSHDNCLILEDDLLIAKDAFHYIRGGISLMKADDTVFSVSLYNDNSVPLYYNEAGAFKRVSHFSGLGFLISKKTFNKYLSKPWPKYLPWDKYFQKKFINKNLFSVQPEVTRSLHVVDKAIKSPFDCRFQHESRLLNNEILDSYDLSWLHENRYDSNVLGLLQNAVIVEYLEDALLVDSVAVFLNCSNKEEMDGVISRKHLEGLGNGKIVRGSYRDLLIMKHGHARLVIVCKTSPFYRLIPPGLKSFSFSASDSYMINLDTGMSSVGRKYLSYVIYLQKARVVNSEARQSCAAACQHSSSRCDPIGLWLLTADCGVLKYFTKYCGLCSRYTEESDSNVSFATRQHPAVVLDGRCLLGNPLQNNCYSTHQYKRLCVCKT